MRYWLACLFIIGIFVTSLAQNLPQPTNPPQLVSDYVGLLSPAERQNLEQLLIDFDDSTSNQIAIVIISSLEGYPIEEYSNKLLRAWGIGTKDKNNGILILVSDKDRKVRIEVGYGLEGAIPDITANEIINNDIKPNFKQKEYYKGLALAVQNLAFAAKGEYNIKKNKVDKDSLANLLKFVLLIIIVIIIVVILSRKNRGGGGVNGGGGVSDLTTGLLIGSMLGSGRSGGGWSSGGSGFGGFGGFGGGSSGGGGASGSW